MQGRHAESWDIISRLHVDGSIVHTNKVSYAQKEFHQMVKQVEMDSHAWIAGGGARQMYSKASYRKRMMMGFFVQYSAQATGGMVVSSISNALLRFVRTLIDTEQTTWSICITTWALTGDWS
jgi:hypothetical protein